MPCDFWSSGRFYLPEQKPPVKREPARNASIFLEPCGSCDSDEFFSAFSSGQTEPGGATIRFQPQIDFKKGAAIPFLNCPFRQSTESGPLNVISRNCAMPAIANRWKNAGRVWFRRNCRELT